jgi:hypothetical protein
MQRYGNMTAGTAWATERGIIAALVTGAFTPPCRLSLIKSLLHPRFIGKVECPDPDCQMEACMGNRMEVVPRAAVALEPGTEGWHFDSDNKAIRSTVVHGKNDRRPGHAPLEYTLPTGPLSKLMLAHIAEGHGQLVLERPDRMLNLFVTRQGAAFNDATFVHFWRTLMGATSLPEGLAYFPPSLARTVFVEDYTSEFGVEPDGWDGAAIIMGNCVNQWRKSYNPSGRNRGAQRAVNAHAAYMDARALGGEE